MPAAAVIPAPIAYIKVVAVKKLVVGFLGCIGARASNEAFVATIHHFVPCSQLVFVDSVVVLGPFTVRKLECSRQAFLQLNIPAWNNKIRLSSYFVGFYFGSND